MIREKLCSEGPEDGAINYAYIAKGKKRGGFTEEMTSELVEILLILQKISSNATLCHLQW